MHQAMANKLSAARSIGLSESSSWLCSFKPAPSRLQEVRSARVSLGKCLGKSRERFRTLISAHEGCKYTFPLTSSTKYPELINVLDIAVSSVHVHLRMMRAYRFSGKMVIQSIDTIHSTKVYVDQDRAIVVGSNPKNEDNSPKNIMQIQTPQSIKSCDIKQVFAWYSA